MGSRKHFLIQNIVRICQKLDGKGFVANHDGNVSVRFDDLFLATPTAESKSAINSDMIITLDQEGKKVEGFGKPFSEMKLHLAAYNARPEIGAVVHAHPPFASALGLCGASLEVQLPEAVISIGHIIPCAPFAMPGDSSNDQIIAESLSEADVFMMPGNGVLAVGADLEQAYLRLELLEHVAKIDFYARQMGEPMRLTDDQLRTLLEKRAQLGLGPQNRPKPEPVSANLIVSKTEEMVFVAESKEASNTKGSGQVAAANLRALISEEIRKALKGPL